MANTKKTSLLEKISAAFDETSNFALVKFDKTKHLTLESLRKNLRKSDASIAVVKNTIFEKTINKLSAKNESLTEFRKKVFPLKESSALLIMKGDWSNGLKAFYEFSKKNESLSFKFGHLDNKVYTNKDLMAIAKLPGKVELMGKLIGTMKNPIARTTRSLTSNMQKLAYILNQRSQQTA